MSKDELQNTQNLNGLFIHGTLLTAEPTKSGKNSEMSWGASVKLKFLCTYAKSVEVKGVMIPSDFTRLVTISISTSDDLLPLEHEKYRKLQGQHVSLNLEPSSNATFKIIEN